MDLQTEGLALGVPNGFVGLGGHDPCWGKSDDESVIRLRQLQAPSGDSDVNLIELHPETALIRKEVWVSPEELSHRAFRGTSQIDGLNRAVAKSSGSPPRTIRRIGGSRRHPLVNRDRGRRRPSAGPCEVEQG